MRATPPAEFLDRAAAENWLREHSFRQDTRASFRWVNGDIEAAFTTCAIVFVRGGKRLGRVPFWGEGCR